MNAIVEFDIVAAVDEAIANRPIFLDRAEINADHVEWAIAELERVGVHPSLSLIVRAIGRGTQRTLMPLVNAFYRRRSEAPVDPPFGARDEALRDLHDIVAKHVRHELQSEFAFEAHRIEDAQEALDRRQDEVENKLSLANERMHAAESLSEGIRRELDEGRSERAALQSRSDQVSQELAQAKQAMADLQQRLNAAEQGRQLLSARAEELNAESVVLHASIATAEERRAVSEAAHATLTRELDEARLRAATIDGLLHAERGRSREQQRRIDELALSELRLSQKLTDAQSRLSRERSIRARLNEEIHIERNCTAALRREANASTKKADQFQRTLELAEAEAMSLKEQLSIATRERRHAEARLVQVDRANRRLMHSLSPAQVPKNEAQE